MNDRNRFSVAWSESVPDTLHIGDSPAYPLARTVAMPAGHRYPTGALSFRFSDLSVNGLRQVRSADCAASEGGLLSVSLLFEPLQLSGSYVVEAKSDPIIDLDTAGDLLELPAEACLPAGADGADAPLTEQQEQWIDQAHAERDRLRTTPNGRRLLAVFDEHNEAFDETFRNYGPLRANWKNRGNTALMARDTHDAAANDTVVNDPEKLYGGNTYNFNAFRQQLNVAVATAMMDPDFREGGTPAADSKYWAAAKAALSFGENVSASTGNDRDTVQEMTPSEVHGAVGAHSAEVIQVTDREAQNALSGSAPAAGAAAAAQSMMVLDEDDREHIRNLQDAIYRQIAEDASERGAPLFTGPCEARLDGIKATVVIGMDGGHARAMSSSVSLSTFDLIVDDEDWQGPAGAIVRERLEQMYFVRSLLLSRLVDELQRTVGIAAAAAVERSA